MARLETVMASNLRVDVGPILGHVTPLSLLFLRRFTPSPDTAGGAVHRPAASGPRRAPAASPPPPGHRSHPLFQENLGGKGPDGSEPGQIASPLYRIWVAEMTV